MKYKRSLFELLMEILGWIQIVASPLLIGLIIGAVIYFPKPGGTKLIIALFIAATGLLIGVIWATRDWKKNGTIHFISKISATTEPGKNDKDQGE